MSLLLLTTSPFLMSEPDDASTSIIDARGQFEREGMAGYARRSLDRITGVDIHYSASPTSTSVASIAAYHMDTQQWPGIAYHYVADGDGRLWWCHDLNRRSYHNGARGANDTRVGICFTGDHTPTIAQAQAMQRAIGHVQQTLGRAMSVRGHRDAPYPTACPGPSWPSWRPSILPL